MMSVVPTQVNFVEIRTVWGYKSFELYQGDIAQLDGETDILIISAFDESYVSSPKPLGQAEAHVAARDRSWI
jgi:hypothetical protein